MKNKKDYDKLLPLKLYSFSFRFLQLSLHSLFFQIRKTQEEKFHGKLSENDARCLLQLNNWDPEAAFKDFCESKYTERND